MAKNIIDKKLQLEEEDQQPVAISQKKYTSFEREWINLSKDETEKTEDVVNAEENSLEKAYLNFFKEFDEKEWTW